MNPFRILRDHLMASGLIFTDKQMADTVSESFRKIKDLEIQNAKLRDRIEGLVRTDHALHELIIDNYNDHIDFVNECRCHRVEYNDLVDYCESLERRLDIVEKVLVKLTD